MYINTFKYLLFISFLIIFITSCASKEIFKNSTTKEYNLSKDDLRLVQYYITSVVTLKRTEKKKETGVTGSNILKTEESVYSKEIILDEGTQGAAVRVSDNCLTIAFDKGLELDFEPLDLNPKTPFTLTKINNSRVTKPGESVIFQDNDYIVIFSELPKLNYKFTSKLNEKREQETVKGMSVEEMFKFENQKQQLNEVNQINVNTNSLENYKEIPLPQRKLVSIILTSKQELNVYIIGESENFLYVSSQIQPDGKPAKISKQTILDMK